MRYMTYDESKLVVKTLAELSDKYNKMIFDYQDTIDRLTEQLRLANEDADRLANAFEIVCDLVDESGILVDRYALRLHEERVGKDDK